MTSGISVYEMFFLRVLVRSYLLIFVRLENARTMFKTSSSSFLAELSQIDQNTLTQKVLIKRPYFIEESSCHWSIAMLCRHLSKVNNGILSFIKQRAHLSESDLPPAKERLSLVKPEEQNNDPIQLENLKVSIHNFIQHTETLSEEVLSEKMLHHPWLGSINYVHWIWFLGFHFKVHQVQLRMIKNNLIPGARK